MFGMYFPDIKLTIVAKFVNVFPLLSELFILMRFKLYLAKLANAHVQIKFLCFMAYQ